MPTTQVAIPGLSVGHWTQPVARTGCTVILLPTGTVASGEVRGGAPATREFELLHPQRIVEQLDAVVLSGGSAFGLSACDGVVTWLAEHGRGFDTTAGPIPIVVGMSLFDLLVGDGSVRPGRSEGRQAIEAAQTSFGVGRVGAGTGATAGKWRGPDAAYDAGFGSATATRGELVVQAFIAANPAGDLGGSAIAEAIANGSFDAWPDDGESGYTNTTIGLVVTNAKLSKSECRTIAEGGHDGFARAIFPPHRRTDGDALVAAATGEVEAECDVVRTLTVVAVEQALRSLI